MSSIESEGSVAADGSWHSVPTRAAADRLGGDPVLGLTAAEATVRGAGRSPNIVARRRRPPCERGNAMLVVAALASAAALVASVGVPALREPLGTVALDARAALVVVGLAVVPALGVEAGKALRRRTVAL